MSPPPTAWSPPPPSGGAISSEPDSPPEPGRRRRRRSSSGSSTTISSSPTTPPPPVLVRGSSGGASSSSSWAPPPTPPPTPPGCAACRHKRQKCPPGCVLAPFFPASDPDRFQSVLRVFGVKNLLRTLRAVPKPRWGACVRAAVCESRMRAADPVRGCSGAVEDLEAQLLDTAVELEVLRRRLESYRLARSRGPRFLRPPNPSHGGGGGGGAAAWPRGVADLDAAARRQLMAGSWASDDAMRPQGTYGGAAWPPAMAATPPQLFYTMQPQGPHGGALPTGTATAELAATPPPPQFYAMQPQGPHGHGGAWPTGMAAERAATPPHFYAMQPPQQYPPIMPPPQLPATQPPQFPAMQPQPAMRRRTAADATRGATAMIRDDFGDSWAGDDERGDDPDGI